MKDLADIVCCTVDYGCFICLAERMGQSVAKSYYYSPFEQEFYDIGRCVTGDGLEHVKRLDEPISPETIEEVDLWIFPDIGYGGMQRYLRGLRKAVWGSMGADGLELYRTRFLNWIQELNLPMVPYQKIKGVTALADYLKTVKDKWVKINRFRGNMETWHHIDWEHSRPKLEEMAVTFGGLKEYVVFVVQDPIPTETELGYDGLNVRGQYPSQSFQGYEKKNELYLGSLLAYKELPGPVRLINERVAPTLEEYGYQNFIATELRVMDDTPYFTDPTNRLPGQTGEHLMTVCSNLPEVILHGGYGELIEPVYDKPFAAEATVHYKADTEKWKVIRIDDEIRPAFKGYYYCEADGLFHFPPRDSDEVGVICGWGDSVQDAIENVADNFEILSKDNPVEIDYEGFADLLSEIHTAEKQGIEFTDQPIPPPESVISDE